MKTVCFNPKSEEVQNIVKASGLSFFQVHFLLSNYWQNKEQLGSVLPEREVLQNLIRSGYKEFKKSTMPLTVIEAINSLYPTPIQAAPVEVQREESIVQQNNPSAKGKMAFSYGNNKRNDVISNTTLDAVKNGERTATTRYESDGHIEYWKNLKIGDTIEWEGQNGEKVLVEVTKPLHKLVGSGKTAEQWSKLEGWSTDYFNSKVRPKLNEAWQIEYKLVIPNNPSNQNSKTSGSSNNTINIFAGANENADLSNFAIRPFTIELHTDKYGPKAFTFQSVEQAFQFLKTMFVNNPQIGKKILQTTNGRELRQLTSKENLPMTPEQVKEWDSKSSQVMEDLIYSSFDQNPAAVKRLVGTGNSTITHKQDTTKWKTEFPRILMKVRELFKNSYTEYTVLDFSKEKQPVNNKIEIIPSTYTRQSVQNDANSMYLFTDNAQRTSRPTATTENVDKNGWYYRKYKSQTNKPIHFGSLNNPSSAVMRGLNNAYPISTMSAYGTDWTDTNFDLFKTTIDDEIDQIKKDLPKFSKIKISNSRIGQGGKFASLPKQHQAYLDSKLLEIGIDNTGDKPKIINNKTTGTPVKITDSFIEENLKAKGNQGAAQRWYVSQLPEYLDNNLIDEQSIDYAKTLLDLIENGNLTKNNGSELSDEFSKILNKPIPYLRDIINRVHGIETKLMIEGTLKALGENNESRTLDFFRHLKTQSYNEVRRIIINFTEYTLNSQFSVRKQDEETTIKLLNDFIAKYSNKSDQETINISTSINENEILYQLPQGREQEEFVASEKTIRDLAARVSDRIGIPVRFEADKTKKYKGKLEYGTAVINLAYATLDTPIHEILGHPIIRAIKQMEGSNTLYQNLLKELEYGKGKEILDRIKRDYKYKVTAELIIDRFGRYGIKQGNSEEFVFDTKEEAEEQIKKINSKEYTLEEQQEEALIELLGLMTADRLDKVKDGKLISLLKRLLKEMKAYIRSLISQKEVEIDKLSDNMTLGDIANLLAYSNSKLILPGYEVIYTTPDNQQFKTYAEASNHISNLAKSGEDVDLSDITLDFRLSQKDLQEIEELENQKKEKEDYFNSKTYQQYKETELDKLNKKLEELEGKKVEFYSQEPHLYLEDIEKYGFQDFDYVRVESTYSRGNKFYTDILGESYEGYYIHGYNMAPGKPQKKILPITKEQAIKIWEKYKGSKYEVADRHEMFRIREGIKYLQEDRDIKYEISSINQKIHNIKFRQNTIKDFIEKNKEYEQAKEIIERWIRINNIRYNPEEVYSRGQEFVSVLGAYSDFDINLMMQNILQHIEDNQKAGGEFTISVFTKPIDKKINHLEGGGGKIKFKIYPQSQDIKWAANTDVFSGSVWDASEKVSKDKKSELLGVSYTKYPSLINVHKIQPNLASIIDDLSHHHNELGISLTGSNFRLEYDEDVPYTTKKLIDSINSILDEKYGKLVKPELSKIENKSTGIQPTQTKETLKESIESVRIKLAEQNYAEFGGEYAEEDMEFFYPEKYDKKEYTSQALVNTIVAKLKNVAKKYPRSLIRSEVRPINSNSNLGYTANELPFQKVSNDSFQQSQQIEKLFEDNTELANAVYSAMGLNVINESEITYTDEDGNPCAKDGMRSSTFTKGSKWEVVKDLKGYPSHAQGGVDIKLGKDGFSFARANSQIKAAYGLLLPKIN